MHVGARLGLLGLGLLAFLATSKVLRDFFPPPVKYGMRAHFEAFDSVRDEIDAIYVGSSRVIRSFRPDVIDPLLSRPGREFRSFNLGLSGMSAREASAFLRRWLSPPPARLRFVVIETAPWTGALANPRLPLSERDLESCTPTVTASVLIPLWIAERSTLEGRIARSRRALRCLAHRISNYGRARSWLVPAEQFGNLSHTELLEFFSEFRGAGWSDTGGPVWGAMRAANEIFERSQPRYQKRVAALATRLSVISEMKRPIPHFNRQLLAWQTKPARDLGIGVIYVEMPRREVDPRVRVMIEAGYYQPLLEFVDPQLNPELYLPEHRWDMTHLNADGAKAFSRAFAERFAPFVEAGLEP